MDVNLYVGIILTQFRNAPNMVYVAVREKNRNRIQFVSLDKVQQPPGSETRVNNHTVFGCSATAKDIAVRLIRTQNQTVDFHLIVLPKAATLTEISFAVKSLDLTNSCNSVTVLEP
jgi:hypothetical protein